VSIFGAIGNAVSGAVHAVLGGDDSSPKQPTHRSSPASKPTTASDIPTGFSGGSKSTSSGSAHVDLNGALSDILRGRDQGDHSRPTGSRRPSIQLYDGSTGVPTAINDPSSSPDASAAASAIDQAQNYFMSTFGRNGLDGAGEGVQIVVDDRSVDAEGKEQFKGNAGFFRMPDANGDEVEALHFGEGTQYNHESGGRVRQASMAYAPDLAIHEYTHGIIERETGHIGGEADEAGAVGEGLADVFAAAATRDWRMGESMYERGSNYTAMRDISNPDDPTVVHGLWATAGEVRQHAVEDGDIEEHYASGVISESAYRIQARIGWEGMEQVFYRALTDHTMGGMSFAETANSLRTASDEIYGEGSAQSAAVDEELSRAQI
jgi:hypothetical protein